MPQVFISYKREQIELAKPIKSKLEEMGFIVWMDENINVGTEWREVIDQEIRNSIALIVIMTPEAKESEYVTYEWSFAYGVGVRVIPLIFRLKPKKLHPRLQTLQYIFYRNSTLMDRLSSSLHQAYLTSIKVHHAIWFSEDCNNDVTSVLQLKIRNLLKNGESEFIAQTQTLGDPFHGKHKVLAIVYSSCGNVISSFVKEDKALELPN